MVSYLYKKNYSSIALNLVEDPKAKFSLAIDSGNLEVNKMKINKIRLRLDSAKSLRTWTATDSWVRKPRDRETIN